MILRPYFPAVGMLVAVAMAAPAVAAPYTYNIIQNQSQLNLTAAGSVLGGVINVEEQFENAPTRYNGTVVADFPAGPGPGGSITFPGGSAAAADTLRGLFNIQLGVSPGIGGGGGSDPANYGLILNAPIDIDLPAIPLPDPIGEIDLGVIDSVQIDIALREVTWDITTALLETEKAIDASGEFDASGGIGSGIQLGLASGFIDLSGSLVFRQDNVGSYLATLAALNALVLAVPDLGLSVDGNPDGNIFTTEVGLGIGTRLDLSGIPDILTLPNGATDPGSVSYNPVTGASTLELPVDITLPDLGIPADLLDLDLNFSGQLVATAFVPEPSSMTLAFFGMIGCAYFGFRRRKA